MHLQTIVRAEQLYTNASLWPQILLYGLDYELLYPWAAADIDCPHF